MKKQFPDVPGHYGAPMGRRDYIDNDQAEVELFRVRMVDGDYDDGGAYWGAGGGPLFCARGDEVELFIRADNWQQAKEFLLDDWPDLKVIESFDIEAMLDAYLECALWSSTDFGEDGNGQEPLDDNYSIDDIDEKSVQAAREDCESFVQLCRDNDLTLLEETQMGHDFWLTRHHHGAGFWDRGLDQLGKDLTKWAQTFSEIDPWVENGKVYFE